MFADDSSLSHVNLLQLASMFADDSSFFLDSQNTETLIETANSELGKVSAWLKANKLSLNISKTKYMFFSQKNENIKP